MALWKIFYGDGTTYDSKQGSEPPMRDVQVIVQYDAEVGRSFWSDCDFYWWEPKHSLWVGGDMAGLLDYMGRCRGATILQGRTVPDSIYRKIKQQALQDPDFPRKSAKYPRERLDGQAI